MTSFWVNAHFSVWVLSQWTGGSRHWLTCRKWRRTSASPCPGGDRGRRQCEAGYNGSMMSYPDVSTTLRGTESKCCDCDLHAPHQTGLLQMLPRRVWFLRCQRLWGSNRAWTERCNTQKHTHTHRWKWIISIKFIWVGHLSCKLAKYFFSLLVSTDEKLNECLFLHLNEHLCVFESRLGSCDIAHCCLFLMWRLFVGDCEGVKAAICEA